MLDKLGYFLLMAWGIGFPLLMAGRMIIAPEKVRRDWYVTMLLRGAKDPHAYSNGLVRMLGLVFLLIFAACWIYVLSLQWK